MNVFAIIVVYNGMRNNWIQKCFDSILNSSIPVHVIAIDNGSCDGSIEFIQQRYPKVDLVVSKENLGFGKANNVGLRKALDCDGEFFFLLNQDAWVEKETIEKLILQSKKNPKYGILSPVHLNGKGDALDYNFSLQITPDRCKGLYSDLVLKNVKDGMYETRFVCAAAWLLTKECLRTVGGFSPSFFHYGEDDNFTHRVKYENLKVGIYPKVSIYHDRHDREKSAYDQEEFISKRDNLVRLSNPNLNNDIVQRINMLKRQKIKMLLKLKSLGSKEKEELKFLEANKLTVISNLEISKRKINYKFLDL